MNKRIGYIVFGCFTAMCCMQVHAQPPLTLQQAVGIALKNNLGIDIGKNNITIADINNDYGIAGGLPNVGGTLQDVQQSTSIDQRYANAANNKKSNNVGSNNFSANITGSVLITNGGRVVSAKQRLGIIEDQSKHQLDSRTQSVVVNVMLKYYDIIRQQAYAKTLQVTIEASKKKLDIVKAQQNVGLANNADLFQAQVDLNTQMQLLQAQQLVVNQGKTDLLYLMTLNPDSAINIADTLIDIDRSIQLDPVMSSIASHPDILAAQDQVYISEHIQKETGAQRYPSLSANAGYTFTRNQSAAGFSLLNLQRGPFIGVTLSVPIFNGGIYQKQYKVAGINAENTKLQKDTLLNGYVANAYKNWQAYTSNLQQLETAQQNYKLSQQLLDLVLQRFQLRQATILEVETAQTSFENAANLLTNIGYAAKAAEIQLKRYSNKLVY